MGNFEVTLNATTAAAGNDSIKIAQVEDGEGALREMKSLVDDLIDAMKYILAVIFFNANDLFPSYMELGIYSAAT